MWHLRDALLAYRHMLQGDALENFRHQQLLYALGALKESPRLPRILRDG
jgi:hypothetical protein